MKKIMLLLIFTSFTFSNSSIPKIKKIKKDLAGVWFEDYVLIYNNDLEFKDTLQGGLVQEKAYFGFNIEGNSVEEILISKDNHQLTKTGFLGSWELELGQDKTIIRLDCDGFLTCGVYEIINFKKNEMVLRNYCKDVVCGYYDYYFKRLK